MTVGIAFALLGQYIAYMFNMRVRLLERVELMFSIISSEVSFLSRPSDELICELAGRKELSELKFLQAYQREALKGLDFRSSWQKALNNRENTRFLNRNDVSLLLSFWHSFGTTDNDGQLSKCSLYLEFVKESLSDARNKRAKYSQMCGGLGILAGIAVVIVFI